MSRPLDYYEILGRVVLLILGAVLFTAFFVTKFIPFLILGMAALGFELAAEIIIRDYRRCNDAY